MRAAVVCIMASAVCVLGFGAPSSDRAWRNYPMTFNLLEPQFNVTDWTRAGPLLERFVQATRNETGVMYYGWITDDATNRLYCREAYMGGGVAITDHLLNVGALFAEVLTFTPLLQVHIHAPPGDLEVIRPYWVDVNPTYFQHIVGYQKVAINPLDRPYTFTTIQPTFTINDYQATLDGLELFVTKTWTEVGNLWYGWDVSEDGTQLYCREAYVDAKAIIAHFDNVGADLTALLNSGAIAWERIHFSGPANEMQILIDNSIGYGIPGLAYFATTTRLALPSDITGFSRFTTIPEI